MKKSVQSKSLKQFLAMFAFIIVIAASSNVFSQNGVGINPTGAPADPSAAVDVSSTTKGFLPPRMTSAQRDAIASSVAGLMIWCNNCGPNGELNVFNGSTWTNMVGGAASLAIGQSYGGGIIAYILRSGDPGYDANVLHGLIAATSDQSSGEWGCSGTAITGADGTALGTGNQNTIDIMNDCSTVGIAARICGDLGLNGYSDWYLPSKDELNKLYQNIGQGNALGLGNVGGFANIYYWSSSEIDANNAWFHYFNVGFQTNFNKNFIYGHVRAVRSF